MSARCAMRCAAMNARQRDVTRGSIRLDSHTANRTQRRFHDSFTSREQCTVCYIKRTRGQDEVREERERDASRFGTRRDEANREEKEETIWDGSVREFS